MSIEVFILGSGGMMPLPRRHLCSIMLRKEGQLILLDCGEGTQVALRKLNLRWKKISTILISHTHADHVTGIPGILMLSSQVDREQPLQIIGPPRLKEYVDANRKILDMYINYEIIVKEITNPGIVYQSDDFQVNAFHLSHSKPCLGYTLNEHMRPGIFYPEKALACGIERGPLWSQLQQGNKVILDNGKEVLPEEVMGPKRAGIKFSYITDTIYTPNIPLAVKQADLLICEGMFTDDLQEDADEKKHLTSKQAARIAKEAAVKSLGLIHYSPRYTKKELKQLLAEAQEIFPATFLTKDLQHIKISNPK